MEISEALVARFNAKWVLNEETGCWEWTGAHLPKGYGIIKKPGERRQVYAHRLSYMIHKGAVPDRMQVCHRCDNPRCVNPEHLFVGTSRDNQQDMKAKNRSLFGEKNGNSKLSAQQVKEIRALAAAGKPQAEIAKFYGVHQVSVGRIVRGDRWAERQ